jgi:hypothetical protein
MLTDGFMYSRICTILSLSGIKSDSAVIRYSPPAVFLGISNWNHCTILLPLLIGFPLAIEDLLGLRIFHVRFVGSLFEI